MFANITMNLINELKLENPSEERLLKLVTDENVSYIDSDGNTALMRTFRYYGSNPNCNHTIFDKILDMNCVPE
jgi:hypothetical protein